MLLLHSELTYIADGKLVSFDFRRQNQTDDISVCQLMNKGRIRAALHPKKPCLLQKVRLTFSYPFTSDTRIFLNGYQSWTDSYEHTPKDKMPGLSHVPPQLRKKYSCECYGDYAFTDYGTRAGQLHGFSYGYLREDETYTLIGSVSERQGFTVIRTDAANGVVVVEKECQGLEITEDYPIFDLCIFRGSEKQVFDAYFAAMKLPEIQAKPVTGYTSWYHHYQNISHNLIMRNLFSMGKSDRKPDVFQIDDGWESFVGDWLTVHPKKFPNGMETIARAVSRQGMLPGIWLAPFVCETDSKLFSEHPDWVLHDTEGKPVKAGWNWSGFYALDIEKKEVRDYIRKVIHTLTADWGYKLLKLDFLYAACLLPSRTKTRGQLMCEAMDFLRECAGDTLLLGCGVPLAPAFGRVDYCRIGPDVTLDWDNTLIRRQLHRERDSTKISILNTAFRRQLNGRAFLNDPDVFILRKENTSLTALQKTWLAKINALCGSVLFTSDEAGQYNENQLAALDELAKLKGHHIRSVEIVKNRLVVCAEKDYNLTSVVVPLSGKLPGGV